jgi:hypothetical protein
VIVGGRELERVTSVAPFGFRLWDSVEHRAVTDGLDVTYSWSRSPARQAVAGSSGVFVMHGLPGFRAFESGVGDQAFWVNPPATPGNGIVEVGDPIGRFLPFRFRVGAPPHRGGRFGEPCATRPNDAPVLPALPHLPLFSAPARPAPGGMAVATAELQTVDGDAAAGAVLELGHGGHRIARGVADERGLVVAMFAYPKPDNGLLGGNGNAPRLPLSAQRWQLDLALFYVPGKAHGPRPDVCEVLGQRDQPAVAVLAQRAPRELMVGATLVYGAPLILRTAGRSALLLDP